jgi:hypothetical protein
MATTTNYGWTTPDDTALVKDGAAAIRTLGTSIDTTTFNNASAAIAKTIVDAKGDIIAATAADTVSRLAVGANDTVLTADSTQATGIKWATVASGGMTLLDTVTLSGATTTSNTFSSSYKQLFVYVNGLYASAEGVLQLRLNADTGANNSFVLVDAYSGTATDGGIADSVNSIAYYGTSSTDLQKTNGFFTVTRPSDTSEVFINSNFLGRRTSQIRWSVGNGIYNNSAAITSILFRAATGTFTAGTAYIYGVN